MKIEPRKVCCGNFRRELVCLHCPFRVALAEEVGKVASELKDDEILEFAERELAEQGKVLSVKLLIGEKEREFEVRR